MTDEKQYKRLTNKNRDEYNPEYDFCLGCEYFGEPNGCNCFNGVCANYERFMETYERLEELEDKIENGTLIELPKMLQDKNGDWRVYFYSENYKLIDCYAFDEKDRAERKLKELQND